MVGWVTSKARPHRVMAPGGVQVEGAGLVGRMRLTHQPVMCPGSRGAGLVDLHAVDAGRGRHAERPSAGVSSQSPGPGQGPWDRRAARGRSAGSGIRRRSEEHTSELQSRVDLVCRLLLEKKKK